MHFLLHKIFKSDIEIEVIIHNLLFNAYNMILHQPVLMTFLYLDTQIHIAVNFIEDFDTHLDCTLCNHMMRY